MALEQAPTAFLLEQAPTVAAARSQVNQAFRCSVYGGGIIVTLAAYGLLQERIMTIPFGGELFTVSAFLVLCNRIVNIIYAAIMVKLSGESLENKVPIWKYMVISFANVAATTCQYECLRYVSFPVQMLGKSFKMAPVMLWGMAISSKTYSPRDWIVAAFVSVGVAEFCATGPMSVHSDRSSTNKGIALLLVFVLCDGLVSTFQEKLFKEHNTSKFNQMLYVNGCSALTSLCVVCYLGKLVDCLAFGMRHGDFVRDTMALSVAAASSQYFIYSEVKEFGALVFAATMNVRQIVSILISYVTYHHAITGLQSIGLVFVFGALFSKSYLGLAAAPKDNEKAPLILVPGKDLRGEPKATV